MNCKEYKLIWTTTNLQELEDKINAMAKEGWKVIATLEGMVLILERDKR